MIYQKRLIFLGWKSFGLKRLIYRPDITDSVLLTKVIYQTSSKLRLMAQLLFESEMSSQAMTINLLTINLLTTSKRWGRSSRLSNWISRCTSLKFDFLNQKPINQEKKFYHRRSDQYWWWLIIEEHCSPSSWPDWSSRINKRINEFVWVINDTTRIIPASKAMNILESELLMLGQRTKQDARWSDQLERSIKGVRKQQKMKVMNRKLMISCWS